jgi:hypothetical protein
MRTKECIGLSVRRRHALLSGMCMACFCLGAGLQGCAARAPDDATPVITFNWDSGSHGFLITEAIQRQLPYVGRHCIESRDGKDWVVSKFFLRGEGRQQENVFLWEISHCTQTTPDRRLDVHIHTTLPLKVEVENLPPEATVKDVDRGTRLGQSFRLEPGQYRIVVQEPERSGP